MDKTQYRVSDVYLAAHLATYGFQLDLEIVPPNRVIFVFSGMENDLSKARNAYFGDTHLQSFVGQIRQMKIALHDRLRRHNDETQYNG